VDDYQKDFVLGNIKARERMIARCAIAGARRGAVIGTDQAAESLTGFFTTSGDGTTNDDFTSRRAISDRF